MSSGLGHLRDASRQRILYSLPDAAYQLSVSERTVKALVADGVLASVKVGHRRLVPHDALLAYVARLEATA